MILAELVITAHGGSCATGNTPYVPARTCSPSDLRNGAFLGAGIVWGLLGAGFLIGGLVGLRGELRSRPSPSLSEDGFD